jgi:hypothetical protein
LKMRRWSLDKSGKKERSDCSLRRRGNRGRCLSITNSPTQQKVASCARG